MGNPAQALNNTGKPWGWIPTVYIAEGLPYFAVNILTIVMYTNLGISKEKMALYTGALYLPWVIKPFWSPFIDIIRTKRWWTLAMQAMLCLCMGLTAIFVKSGNFFFTTLTVFWFMAFFSATHDIAADGYYMMALNEKEQAAFVGVRSTFYRIASVIGQGGIVMIAGVLEEYYGVVSSAWSVTFGILSILFLLIFIWDFIIMPRPERDKPLAGVTSRKILKDFALTFVTFFEKKYVVLALLFILLYRLPEALCLKMLQPFFLDSQEAGGLGLSTSQVGFVNGTVGVICLLAGGIAGGLAIARGGLRKWIWVMALSLTLPSVVYLLFSIFHPPFIWINVGTGIEQFGYGFGFTAYMMFLMYFSKGESQTSHYSFCTAFMALGMMLPGMFAGHIFNHVKNLGCSLNMDYTGYPFFFALVMVSCLFTFISVALIKPILK